MTEKGKNDLFYVCSLIEYVARITNNKRAVIVNALGIEGIKKQLHDAETNHCLSFEQVGDEMIEDYSIKKGEIDTITECPYAIPGYQDIGKLYSIMIEHCVGDGTIEEEVVKLFNSFISEEISDFSSDLYYQNPDYLENSYKEGYLLD